MGCTNQIPAATSSILRPWMTSIWKSLPTFTWLGTPTGCNWIQILVTLHRRLEPPVASGVTGLNDPNTPIYLYEDGIRYVVTDTSVIGQTNNGPNPSPNVGIVNSYEPGIYEVPRHPNDVFYNAANWADDQAEFSCIYNNPVDPPFNTYDAAQILDYVSSSFVTNMLIGDMDPEMFHQPDLHFSDNGVNLGLSSSHISSLLSDTYDMTFNKYEALYLLPVLSPTL